MEPTVIHGLLGDDPPKASLYYGLNVIEALRQLPDNSVNVVCTSPPYWGLRNYGVPPQVWGGDETCSHEWGDDAFCTKCEAWRGHLGLEPTPQLFVKHMVLIGREVRRVLHPSGTFWMNLGDSYMSNPAKSMDGIGGFEGTRMKDSAKYKAGVLFGQGKVEGLKTKDKVMVPHRVAIALLDDGWWVRNDIIWEKCLGGSTRLYARTQKGDMPAYLKDLVRLDPSTVKLWNGSQWVQVVRWERVESAGLQLEFRSGEKVSCTPEHRWPTSRGLLETRDMVVGDVVNTTTLPDNTMSPDMLPDEDVGWFVGVYLAEGSKGGGGKTIQIAGHVNETARYERLARIAEKYHGVCQMHPTRGNAATINMHGSILHGILDTYISGNTAQHKHLSMKCWERGNGFLRAVMQGYLHGDGHHDEQNNRYRLGFCRNKNLAADLRTLAARLGTTLTLKPSFNTFQGGRKPAYRGEWRWDRSGHHNEKERSEIVAIRKAAGRIFYDIEVAEDPHLFATASGLLTHNSNAMPSSVRDRFSSKYENVFMFSKSKRYFFDLDAVKVKHTSGASESTGKNPGNVWRMPTGQYPGAHFAVWPEVLVERMIKAGSSEQGRCPHCLTPWTRITEKHGETTKHGPPPRTVTVGWEPDCDCPEHEPERCVVMDIFSGSATTGKVAMKQGRDYVGLDLNPDYLDLAYARLTGRRAPKKDAPTTDFIGDLFG